MLMKLNTSPGLVLVDPSTLMPRFWATVWTSGVAMQSLSKNYLAAQLRYVGAFYQLCDQRYGHGAFDRAVGEGRIADVQIMVVDFYHSLTSERAASKAPAATQSAPLMATQTAPPSQGDLMY